MSPTYQQLVQQLSHHIEPTRIITDPTLTLAYGTDASFYRLTPHIVLQLDSIDEVVMALRLCYQSNVAVTFRAAGTSLSGQAISDSVLIMLTPRWKEYEILNNGQQISLQPGLIGADVNRLLAPFGRKIGPDPASINSCKIGGIAANNSSGMCCGTAQNSYHTLAGMTIVLFDGTVLNTRDQTSIEKFQLTHSKLLSDIKELSQHCLSNQSLTDKIRHKYRLKNTTGYSINALIDYDDPIDILQHLMIGSEGTLGFIAEITYNTVPDHPFKACGLYLFKDIETTCLCVSELSKTSVTAVELMDSRALASVADKPGMPAFISQLSQQNHQEAAALLVEIHAEDQQQLEQQQHALTAIIDAASPIDNIKFSQDSEISNQLWAVRKGLFPAVGAVRETGTTVIIEDVAFPLNQLAQATRELQQLFEKYHYDEAIIFGHALDGNLHFVFTQAFDSSDEVERYSDFMDDVSHLVAVKYQGSLKAEHGTGRNMAPYVELEWGADGFALMQQIKAIFDPKSILNPGVIINEDNQAHLKDLKAMPAADVLIDKCIECGFCEPVCPSRDLSLTPRQRNSVYREISRLRRTQENPERLAELEKSFQYLGINTCAATGLCAERCPVDINTGDLMRKLREVHSPAANSIARWSADHFATVTKAAKVGLSIADGIQRITGHRIPLWSASLPTAASKVVSPNITAIGRPKIVYFPSCASRTMGSATKAMDPRPLHEVTISLLKKAGYEVIIPDNVDNACCGMPYHSKGYVDTHKNKSTELEQLLLEASNQGSYPILMDTSPCARLSKTSMSETLTIFEPFQFIADYLLPKLTITQQNEPVMLHITCTSRRSGLARLMKKVTEVCAKQVIIPNDIECCGFAGDKGFTVPELNASALSTLKQQIPDNCTQGYSNSRTCEIGLTEHSKIEYRSILYLVDRVSQ